MKGLDIARVVASEDTVSNKIRALAAGGVPRAEIARLLGKRYQHVRNVLEDDAQGGGYVLGRADLSGVREAPAPFEHQGDDRAVIDESTVGSGDAGAADGKGISTGGDRCTNVKC